MASELYLVSGENEYQVDIKAREIAEGMVAPEDRAFGLDIIDGAADNADGAVSALRRCLESIQTLGFLGGRKVVWLKNVNFLHEGRTGNSDAVKGSLADIIDVVKKGSDRDPVLIISAGKADKRKAFYKACESLGKVSEFGKSNQREMEKEASAVVSSACSRMKMRMDTRTQNAFVAKVGTDERQILSEMEKMRVYLGDRDTVEMKDIDAVTSASRENIVWDLTGAVRGRDLGRAVAVLRRLLFQKENSIGILMMIQQEVRNLILFKEAVKRRWISIRQSGKWTSCDWRDLPPAIEKTLSEGFAQDPRKMHPYRISLFVKDAGNFAMTELESALNYIRDAHIKLVSSSMPDGIVLELLLVKMLVRS